MSGAATVEFENNFTQVPSVTITSRADGTALFSTITNITQKSFEVIFWNGERRFYGSGTFEWIAVGK